VPFSSRKRSLPNGARKGHAKPQLHVSRVLEKIATTIAIPRTTEVMIGPH
jgi:hypothetical protein